MNPLIVYIQNQIARCEAQNMWIMAEFWRGELVKLLNTVGKDGDITRNPGFLQNLNEKRESK